MLMQMPGPRDIVIYWPPPGHFMLCKSPGAGHPFRCKSLGAGHPFRCKSPGVPGGIVTGQTDACITAEFGGDFVYKFKIEEQSISLFSSFKYATAVSICINAICRYQHFSIESAGLALERYGATVKCQ